MTSEAPGWDAIDARLAEFYPGIEPKHFAAVPPFAIGGTDPLDGVSFFAREEPVPHWHVVGYGLSELYTKETDVPEESGWGFELTFRPGRDAGDTEPPMWAAGLLQNLARYVISSGNWFEPGHHMNANGPIQQGYPTEMTALGFTEDPELGTIDTPHGRLQFLQVVGLTTDEYTAAQGWNTGGVLALLAERQPLHVTDLDRPSITDDPEIAAAIAAGEARDGSSTGMLLLAGFDCAVDQSAVRLSFKKITTTTLPRAIHARLGHGRELLLLSDKARVRLRPARAFTVHEPADGPLELDLPPAVLAALIDALTHPGPVTGAAGLTVEILDA